MDFLWNQRYRLLCAAVALGVVYYYRKSTVIHVRALSKRRNYLSSRDELELPLFVAQREHLLRVLEMARQPFRILLFEGAPGIGKGSSLRHWCRMSNRPSYYVQLRSLNANGDAKNDAIARNNAGTDSDTDCVSISTFIARAIGVSSDSSDHVYSDFLDALAARECGLLVVDDLQVLFDGISPLMDMYTDMPQFFNWMLECTNRGLLDIVLCSSQKSVLVAMKRLGGYNTNMSFCSVDSVADESVVEYLLHSVNATLDIKFDLESASRFVETFSGSLDEIVRFKQMKSSVSDYIQLRRAEFLEYLERNLPNEESRSRNPYEPPRPDNAEFKELILDLSIKNSGLPIWNMHAERLHLVHELVQKNFLRWSRSAEEQEELQMSSIDEPLAFLKRGDTHIVWYSRLVADVCLEWLNKHV